jgi:alpha-N-arabinofuranosidase
LVNTIAPIRTEPGGASWRQTIFYPFALTARHAKGDVLRVEPKAPTYHSSAYGDVPVIDAIATRDPQSGDATIFAVNRHQREPVRLRVSTAALTDVTVQAAYTLTSADPSVTNTEDTPDRVTPTPIQVVSQHKTLQVELAPVAWTCIRLATRPR